MKMKLPVIAIVIMLMVVVITGLSCDGNPPDNTPDGAGPSEAICEILIAGGIEAPEVALYEDSAIIRYNEPLVSTETELIGKWVFIMGTTVKEAPWIDEVIAQPVLGEDAVLEVTGETDDIIAFLCGETTSEELLPKLAVRPVGKGPVIEPPGE